jgi:hypothetical protein
MGYLLSQAGEVGRCGDIDTDCFACHTCYSLLLLYYTISRYIRRARSSLQAVCVDNEIGHRGPEVATDRRPFAEHQAAGGELALDEGESQRTEERRFCFDIALSGGPYALPSLLAFADPTHILYGSDWPFATPETVAYFNGLFEAYPLDEETRAATYQRRLNWSRWTERSVVGAS